MYLRNLLCFLHHYGIELVVYVVQHGVPDVEAELRAVEGLGVRALTYPDALFWSVVAQKTTYFRYNRRTFASYVDDEPSFHSYGTLTVMVPLLEVLEAGYTALFCDVDVGLVQDPVPHMVCCPAPIQLLSGPDLAPYLAPAHVRRFPGPRRRRHRRVRRAAVVSGTRPQVPLARFPHHRACLGDNNR